MNFSRGLFSRRTDPQDLRARLLQGQGLAPGRGRKRTGLEVRGTSSSPRFLPFPGPWSSPMLRKSFERADYLYATGLELMNAGSFKEAAERLAEARSLKSRPARDRGRLRPVPLFPPGLREGQSRAPAPRSGRESVRRGPLRSGRTCHALGEFTEAVGYYRRVSRTLRNEHRHHELPGDLLFPDREEGRGPELWEKSLQISPGQPTRSGRLVDESLKKNSQILSERLSPSVSLAGLSPRPHSIWIRARSSIRTNV